MYLIEQEAESEDDDEITLMMINPQKNDHLGIAATKHMILQMPFLPNGIGAMFQIEEVGKTKFT